MYGVPGTVIIWAGLDLAGNNSSFGLLHWFQTI